VTKTDDSARYYKSLAIGRFTKENFFPISYPWALAELDAIHGHVAQVQQSMHDLRNVIWRSA
jgi:hypothetical protein